MFDWLNINKKKEGATPNPHEFGDLRFVEGMEASKPFDLADPKAKHNFCDGLDVKSGKVRCTFEELVVGDKSIIVNHFAMRGDWIGKSNAESCLRAFAKMVSVQAPDIDTIQFKLHKFSLRAKDKERNNEVLIPLKESLQPKYTSKQIEHIVRRKEIALEEPLVIQLAKNRLDLLQSLRVIVDEECLDEKFLDKNYLNEMLKCPKYHVRNSVGDLRITVMGTWPKANW